MEAFAKAGFWHQLHAALDKQVLFTIHPVYEHYE